MKTQTQEQARKTMNKVLEVRYSDLALEQSLCNELLELGSKHGDKYITAFANTYLGDYYVAMGATPPCIAHLTEARSLALENGYNELLVRIYSLMGLYYEMTADEQSSMHYCMEGIAAARKVGDRAAEGLILNNIANNFQRHCGYEQALQCYKEAYELLRPYETDNSVIGCIILNNLAMVSIQLGQLDKVELYMEQCEALGGDTVLGRALCAKNRCRYYTAIGDTARAGEYLDEILSLEERISENKMHAFDVYSAMFDSMMQQRNATAAAHFLELLEECCAEGSADQLHRVEESRITYCRAFETDEERLAAAYQRYCQRTIELTKMSNKSITNGLTVAIRLFRVNRHQEKLTAEQDDLKSRINTDELTGVYNRRYLEGMIKQYEKTQTADMLGFIMIDVDCLKEYNDNYGHTAGDEVLRTVGGCLSTHAPPGIIPCRFGGDEFVCMCIGMTDEAVTDYICAVRDDLRERNIQHDASRCARQVSLSIGFANSRLSDDLPVRTLLDWADKALYSSKINGRNTYSRYD